MCVCLCVCVCARARVRACVCVLVGGWVDGCGWVGVCMCKNYIIMSFQAEKTSLAPILSNVNIH